jgi:hypothetical protein
MHCEQCAVVMAHCYYFSIEGAKVRSCESVLGVALSSEKWAINRLDWEKDNDSAVLFGKKAVT